MASSMASQAVVLQSGGHHFSGATAKDHSRVHIGDQINVTYVEARSNEQLDAMHAMLASIRDHQLSPSGHSASMPDATSDLQQSSVVTARYNSIQTRQQVTSVLGMLRYEYLGTQCRRSQTTHRQAKVFRIQKQKKQRRSVRIRLPTWLVGRVWEIATEYSVQGWTLNVQTWNLLPGNAEIFQKINNRDLRGVRNMLESGQASLFDQSKCGCTLLHVSVSQTYPNTFNFSDRYQLTAQRGNEELCRWLVQQGAIGSMLCDFGQYVLISNNSRHVRSLTNGSNPLGIVLGYSGYHLRRQPPEQATSLVRFLMLECGNDIDHMVEPGPKYGLNVECVPSETLKVMFDNCYPPWSDRSVEDRTRCALTMDPLCIDGDAFRIALGANSIDPAALQVEASDARCSCSTVLHFAALALGRVVRKDLYQAEKWREFIREALAKGADPIRSKNSLLRAFLSRAYLPGDDVSHDMSQKWATVLANSDVDLESYGLHERSLLHEPHNSIIWRGCGTPRIEDLIYGPLPSDWHLKIRWEEQAETGLIGRFGIDSVTNSPEVPGAWIEDIPILGSNEDYDSDASYDSWEEDNEDFRSDIEEPLDHCEGEDGREVQKDVNDVVA